MGKREKPLADQQMIKALVKTAVDAAAQQRFFEASVIIFQTVEGLLRIAIKVFGKAHGIRADVLEKCADTETSFWRLVLHYDMIRPNNGLGERLLALNARRNKMMHRLFYDFASMEHLDEEMKAFCKEAMALNIALQEDLGLSG
ncbi:MAG: hypothetical protein JRI36_07100 [Deltaproteobacteria bacterium]|nr:hypothetical protein [Deltaproteobacteria bacterium]